MKRTLSVLILFSAIATGIWAQSGGSLQALLDPLQADMESLLSGIGNDIAPVLLQTALAGDLVGEAAFKGNFPHGSVTFPVPAIGVSLGNGIATVLNNSSHSWQFVLPLPDLIDQVVPASGTGHDIYQATRQVFPYPSFAIGFGFVPYRDIEVLASGFYLPQVLTGKLLGLASLPTMVTDLDPQLSTTSILVKVRKVLFRDQHRFPAMSIALGGLYSDFNLGATVNLASLNGGKGVDMGSGTLNLVGDVASKTSLYGAGLEFAISKKIPVLTPFAKVGIWYRHAEVDTTIDLDATITPTDTAVTPVTQPIQTTSIAIDEGIDAQISGGLEIRLFALIIHLQANLDLEDPLIDISSLSLTGVAANGLSVNMGLRWAF